MPSNMHALVTTAGSPLTSLTDLAGKKVGVNGTSSVGTLLRSGRRLRSTTGCRPR